MKVLQGTSLCPHLCPGWKASLGQFNNWPCTLWATAHNITKVWCYRQVHFHNTSKVSFFWIRHYQIKYSLLIPWMEEPTSKDWKEASLTNDLFNSKSTVRTVSHNITSGKAVMVLNLKKKNLIKICTWNMLAPYYWAKMYTVHCIFVKLKENMYCPYCSHKNQI